MKRHLFIIRHARAEEGGLFFSDFNRELATSGIMDAAKMGKFLAEKGVKPDAIVSSAAPRASKTAQVMAEQLGFAEDQILTTQSLYAEGPRAYMAVVNAASESCQCLLIVGHNPDVSYFAEYLTGAPIGFMSKGSVVEIVFDDLRWAAVSANTGTFVSYDRPKQLSSQT